MIWRRNARSESAPVSSSKPETGNIEIFTQDFPWKRSGYFLPVPLFYKSWGWLWPICAFLLRVWLVVAIALWPHRRFCWQPWDKKTNFKTETKGQSKTLPGHCHCLFIIKKMDAHFSVLFSWFSNWPQQASAKKYWKFCQANTVQFTVVWNMNRDMSENKNEFLCKLESYFWFSYHKLKSRS